jgi:hypothetical protein
MDNGEWMGVKLKMDMSIKKFSNIRSGAPNEALSPFLEYVRWLRMKYMLKRYEIVDEILLYEYEQELIALLREEWGDKVFWIEICT